MADEVKLEEINYHQRLLIPGTNKRKIFGKDALKSLFGTGKLEKTFFE